MSAILALPDPSTLPATTTVSRARALVLSQALPVTPVRQVPDETRRQQLREAVGRDGDKDDSSSPIGGSSQRSRVSDSDRSQAQVPTGNGGNGKQSSAGGGTDSDAYSPPSGPNAAFVAQSLYQESIGTGLHIEPWDAALGAYRRADSLATTTAPRSLSV